MEPWMEPHMEKKSPHFQCCMDIPTCPERSALVKAWASATIIHRRANGLALKAPDPHSASSSCWVMCLGQHQRQSVSSQPKLASGSLCVQAGISSFASLTHLLKSLSGFSLSNVLVETLQNWQGSTAFLLSDVNSCRPRYPGGNKRTVDGRNP